MHVGLFESQHDLPGDSDAIEEVVDKPDVVDESVHVTGAEHEQRGETLEEEREWEFLCVQVLLEITEIVFREACARELTVKSRAGMGVQRLT